MIVRRVVAGTDEQGRSVILSDGPAPNTHDFQSLPGQSQTRIWFTPEPAVTTPPSGEPTTSTGPVIPGVGGASFLIVRFAPDSVADAPGFDPAKIGEEFATWAPDIGAASDPDEPGMHRTQRGSPRRKLNEPKRGKQKGPAGISHGHETILF